jgi:hypothetical protein
VIGKTRERSTAFAQRVPKVGALRQRRLRHGCLGRGSVPARTRDRQGPRAETEAVATLVNGPSTRLVIG